MPQPGARGPVSAAAAERLSCAGGAGQMASRVISRVFPLNAHYLDRASICNPSPSLHESKQLATGFCSRLCSGACRHFVITWLPCDCAANDHTRFKTRGVLCAGWVLA